ncbi:MAG: EVE domain-containing protein [Phycisphaerales bacterium]|nr:EVE domain-containing protein [Phycisphaerales bacterium]
MAIPQGITLDDIHEAAARLDAGASHPFGEPRKYQAVIHGTRYPPKALVGLAARRVLGHDLTPGDFSSGVGPNQAVAVLQSLGVEIVEIGHADPRFPPAAWIFQGNPDHFDIDGYLASTTQITWLANQHRQLMAKGQTVYLWRNSGRGGAIAGVVAVGVIEGDAESRPDHSPAVPYWKDPMVAAAPAFRVPIRVVEVATAKQVLKSKWLEEDPVCHDLPNLRMRQQTNYLVTSSHADRLARLWAKTGRDFDRSDLLLTLAAYAETFGQEVSKLHGSPVSNTALLAGRAVTSIYSKVMNFRALDPRVPGMGQPNTGQPTKDIWNEFWTGSDIDTGALAAAIGSAMEPGTTPASQEALESEVEHTAPEYSAEGRKRLVIHFRIERNRKVVADAKAKWFNANPNLPCCVCGMSFRETYGDIGEGYIEAHHTEPIATLDLPKVPVMDDLVPVCSNCHRMLHRSGSPDHRTLEARLQARSLLDQRHTDPDA